MSRKKRKTKENGKKIMADTCHPKLPLVIKKDYLKNSKTKQMVLEFFCLSINIAI